MLLPKNERRNINIVSKKVVWLYGAPFSGKTYFANKFPDPLMLNTDGNIKFVDAPFIPIKDSVSVEGRITKRTLAWQVFKDTIDELEKKQNDFKTVVVDLLEDLYEACRLFMYDKKNWEHESDDSFRAWDMVRTEFLSTLRRLMNLDYENIILISHEDKSRDITKKSGDKITSIKPNLQDKVANKVAGMVDVVARVVADGDVRVLSFKTSEVIFGGGRLTVSNQEIPLDYAAFCKVYDEANGTAKAPREEAVRGTTPPVTETPPEGEQTPRRRSKKTPEPDADSSAPKVQETEQPVQDDATPPAPEVSNEEKEADAITEMVESNNLNQLPKCPDGERIFKQNRDSNGEIPLCPRIDAGHHCHKEGGPDGCPLLNKPSETPADPGTAPVKRTRKKRDA